MGDFVKGHDYNDYPANIKKGLILHRNIDTFTDKHPIVRQSKSYIAKKYRKYSGIIIDIVYDHFLSQNWMHFANCTLEDFTKNIYRILDENMSIFPEEVKEIVPSFVNDNWIKTYQTIEGIERVLRRMSSRTTLPDETDFAIEVLREKYAQIEQEFLAYFPELINFVHDKFDIDFTCLDD